jgi:aminocarboxymuconate-semialdehyde decarboxylase
MIIDFHTHVHPPEDAAEPLWQGRSPMTIENVLKAQETGGVDVSFISNPLHHLARMDRDQQYQAVDRSNNYLASLQEKHASIFAFAVAVPWGGDRFLNQFEATIKQNGMLGAWIPSSLQGQYPDDDEALPFFQLAAALDVPVVIHPPAAGFGDERMQDYRLTSSVGRPMDNALATARLIVRGIFEKIPNLKLVVSHLGGGICEMIGRMDYAYNLREEAFFLGPYEPLLIKHAPSYYLKKIYLESTSYHIPAARCAVETVGVDHFVFGTDAPPMFPLKKEGVALIRRLNLSRDDEEKVYAGNACRLVNLESRLHQV